jgi:CheY-like chemotaxis protein
MEVYRMGTKRLENLTIVVVDDQEDARTAVGHYLSSLGADVHTSDEVDKALNILPAFEPDLIITDIRLPGKDGFELLRTVRSLDKPSIRDVPIVAMTALADGLDQMKNISPRFNGFLRKPFTPDALLRVISELLAV